MQGAQTNGRSSDGGLCSRRFVFLWIGLAAFASTILFVGPVRETAFDDDWVYALMVQHLLQTNS